MTRKQRTTQCRLCGSSNTRLTFVCRYQGGVWPIWECQHCDVQFIEDTEESGRNANLKHYDASTVESTIAGNVEPSVTSRYWGLLPSKLGIQSSTLGVSPSITSRYWRRRLARIRLAYEASVLRSKNIRICDAGCNLGDFLAECPAAWEKYGVELSPAFAEYAAARGLVIHNGLLEDANYPTDYFDVVTMYSVIEHVYDLGAFVREARRIIRPGGLLVLGTGNRRSLQARVVGQDWPLYIPPVHQFFFLDGR